MADRDKSSSSGGGEFKLLLDFNFSLSISINLSFAPFDENLHPRLIFLGEAGARFATLSARVYSHWSCSQILDESGSGCRTLQT